MTIDSAYQLELYNPDNDREYFFEFESTGVTTFILWIDYTENGVPARVSLPPGTGDFDIEFEGRDPIYKRGKITLTDQFFQAFEGLEITRLTMQRKTPIFKDVTFEANGEWNSEAFEYEIDKICMIQQEIEGHYCDCREQEQGLDPIENVVEEEYYEENPECRPYACDAFADYLVSIGVTPVLTYQANTDPWVCPFTSSDPITAYGFFTSGPTAITDWSPPIADDRLTATWPATTNSQLEFCDGAIQQAVITSAPSLGTKAFIGDDSFGDGGFSAIITGWDGTMTISGELFRGPGKYYRIEVGSGNYYAPLATIGIYSAGGGEHELRLFIDGGGNGDASINVPLGVIADKWIVVSGHISSSEPVVVRGPVPGFSTDRDWFTVELTISARVNGIDAELSHQYRSSSYVLSSNLSLTPVANIPQSQRRLFYQSQLSFAAVNEWVADGEVDLEALERNFFRNFSDYLPPEYCIFPQG